MSRASLAAIKPATHLAILYADRRDRRKSPGAPGAAIAIFAGDQIRRDRRIKSPGVSPALESSSLKGNSIANILEQT